MPAMDEDEMRLALVWIRTHPSLRRGRKTLHRTDMTHTEFEHILGAMLQARDRGLTRIRETRKMLRATWSVVFEQVLAPAGEMFLCETAFTR